MWSCSSSFSSRRPKTPPSNPKLCCFRCSFPPPLIGKNQQPRVRKCITFVRSRTRTRNNNEKMTVPQQRKDDDDDGDFDGSMIDDDNLDEDLDEDDMEFFKAAASLQFGASNKKKVVAPGFYVVSTPIGNLEDITIRALKILNEATLILCEDTRKTRQLLTLLGVQSSSSQKGKQKKLLAYHSHNFYEQRETLRDRIVRNEDEEVIALVSDAGAPVVSDPGQDLVDLVLEATKANGGGGGGERKSVVVPIPGASAVTTAVIGSGFKCDDGYRFCGFLPAKKNERVKVLESLTSETSLLVFFVSPHKLVKTLEDVAAVYSKSPPRRVCVARELTKRHEEFFRGTCEECLEEFSKEGRARGEITLLVESSDFCASTKKTTATKVAPKDINDDDDTNDDDESDKNTAKVLLEKTLRHLLLERAENQRLSVSEAARKVSQDLGVKRRVAYSLAQKIKDSSSGNTNSE